MGRINKTNKTTPVSADEFIIYDSEDTTDDKNVTLGQVASFTESQDSTITGTKIFADGVEFQKGNISFGQYTPFPTGLGPYTANYVSPTYGARMLAYNGSAYQDLSIGSMPTAGTVSMKSLANGDCNFGYNVNIAEDLNVTGDIVSIGNSTAAKFIGDGSELTGTDKISFALNSGQVDASGNADLLAGTTSTTLSFKVDDGTTYKPLQATYADGSQEILTSLASITGLSVDGTYTVIKEKGSNPIVLAPPVYGKDLFVDFSQGNANDNYGLHTPTVVGSPTFTGNKFNSNGTTGLQYPITTLGSGAWCVQGRFKSTNTTTRQQIFNGKKSIRSFEVCKSARNRLSLYLSADGFTDFYTVDNAGVKTDWAVGTEYYIRLRFTGTQYLVDWSTDYNPLTGIGTWTNDITVSNTTIVYPPIDGIFYGIFGDNNIVPLIGTMDDLQVTVGQSVCQRKNQVTQGKTLPLYPINGDYHCLTATGLQTYKRVAGAWVETQYVPLGTATVASNVISAVSTNGYNRNGYDTAEVSFPSNKYINLTLGASGSTYIAPADGWLKFSTMPCTTAGYQYIGVESGFEAESRTTFTNSRCVVTAPMKKGQKATYNYDSAGTRYFMFIYAEGSKP